MSIENIINWWVQVNSGMRITWNVDECGKGIALGVGSEWRLSLTAVSVFATFHDRHNVSISNLGLLLAAG